MAGATNPRIDLLRAQIGKPIDFDYPILKYLDFILIEADEGSVKVEMTVRKDLLNPAGIMHGGVMTMLMDELMGTAAWTLNRPDIYVTINLNTDFLSGAREHDKLIGTGKILRAGKNVLHGEAWVYHSGGKLLAKSASNLIKTG